MQGYGTDGIHDCFYFRDMSDADGHCSTTCSVCVKSNYGHTRLLHPDTSSPRGKQLLHRWFFIMGFFPFPPLDFTLLGVLFVLLVT